MSTVNTSTNRLRRSARAELSSAAGRSNLIPTSLAAPSTSRARVDEMTWVKMLSDIHSGRVLHRTRLRGYRAKGSAIATTAATAPARQRCERGRGGGGFIVTLADPDGCASRCTLKVQEYVISRFTAWDGDGGRGSMGVLVSWRGQKRGSQGPSGRKIMHNNARCHCDVRKIVPCQPRAQARIAFRSMGNEV